MTEEKENNEEPERTERQKFIARYQQVTEDFRNELAYMIANGEIWIAGSHTGELATLRVM